MLHVSHLNLTGRKPGSSELFISTRLFQPRSDCEAWEVPTGPMDFEIDPFGDDNWKFQLNALRAIDPFFTEDIFTPGIKFQTALAHMLQWIECDNRYGDANGFRWHDMATGLRAQKLALLLDLARVSEEDEMVMENLQNSVSKHMSKLMDPDFFSHSNHGIFQMHGLMALAKVTEGNSSENAAEYSSGMIMELINKQFDDEGIHTENSPEYHFFAINILQPIFDSGWYDFPRINALWDKILLESCWLLWPDGRYVEVGDSSNNKKALIIRNWQKEMMEVLNQKSWRSGDAFGEHGYLIREYNHSGYTVVRTPFDVEAKKSSMLFSTSAFNSTTHRHADDLSFTIFEKGDTVFTDPGKYLYGSSKGRNYVQSTLSHNCLSFDGRNFPLSQDHFYQTARQWTKEYSWGFGILFHRLWPNINSEQWRIMLYRPGAFIGVVDVIRAERERQFTQWFHLNEKYEKFDLDSNNRITVTGGSVPLKGVFISDGVGGPSVEVSHGSEEPFQGWTSPTYGTMVPSFAIGSNATGKSSILGALFSFGGGALEMTVQIKSNHLWIKGEVGDVEINLSTLLGGYIQPTSRD